MRGFVEKIIGYCSVNPVIVLLFAGLSVFAGYQALMRLPLDALPDLSDTQVIIYSRWDRSPDIVEAQVTYPIITALLGAPGVKTIRGYSDFGYSYVYILFEDGTDIYWARSRVLEYLSRITPQLPRDVVTELGPDATGVGWVFQYALTDDSGKLSLADLRTLQDWYLRYQLQSIPGVAEVAPIGGFVRQYQINVIPERLLAYNVSLMQVIEAVREGNEESGGRLIEFSGIEYMVRGRGYVRSISDIENMVVTVDEETGTPVLIGNVARVVLGPDIRRGVSDLNGRGDAVGGIIVMRQGESALRVIEGVKERLNEIQNSLPDGVKIITTYDRTELIEESISTIGEVLYEDFLIVALIIIFLLLHFRSALIPILLIPCAAIIAFVPMLGMKITVNVMSITGIVLAIGDMVDVGVVMIENVHSKLADLRLGRLTGGRAGIMIDAMKEVGPTVFSSLIVTVIGLAPMLALEEQEGRLFRPLASMQIFSIFVAALLSITLIPALIMIFLKNAQGRSFEDHFATRYLARKYAAALDFAIRKRTAVLGGVAAVMLLTVPVYLSLGSEFMPALFEGTFLYMPTTTPGISVTEAHRLLQIQDRALMRFPEVEHVFGKAGRAETATDPAPFSMMETLVELKDKDQWRKVPVGYDFLPEFARPLMRRILPLHRRITHEELVREMDEALRYPGVRNAWTMPIRARIDMLTTGVRTPVGIKIFGQDLDEIQRIGEEIEKNLQHIRGTRSVYAERTGGGYFIDFDLDREKLGRYGISISRVQMVIMSAIGGENLSTVIEGRERYSINVRYARELRDDMDRLKRVLVPAMGGKAQIPLGQLARIVVRTGPSMIRDENGLLAGYVYVDVTDRDVGGYVEEARSHIASTVRLKTGYTLQWSGQYEYMERVKRRLMTVIPIALCLIFILYYFNFKSAKTTMMIMLSMPFTAVGGILGVKLMGYNMSVAVWAGMIEVIGIGAALSALVTTFILQAHAKVNYSASPGKLIPSVIDGASRVLRPAIMTCAADIFGLVPSLWATGIGAEFIKRYTVPIIFGLITGFVLALIVLPVIYVMWKIDLSSLIGNGLPRTNFFRLIITYPNKIFKIGIERITVWLRGSPWRR